MARKLWLVNPLKALTQTACTLLEWPKRCQLDRAWSGVNHTLWSRIRFQAAAAHVTAKPHSSGLIMRPRNIIIHGFSMLETGPKYGWARGTSQWMVTMGRAAQCSSTMAAYFMDMTADWQQNPGTHGWAPRPVTDDRARKRSSDTWNRPVATQLTRYGSASGKR